LPRPGLGHLRGPSPRGRHRPEGGRRVPRHPPPRGGRVVGAEPILVATDLVAGYPPGLDILTGTNSVLHGGDPVGIIGPNGAGKSTLVKAMFGLVPVRSGSVTLRGRDITNLKAHSLVSLGVGYVPQTNNVFPNLTIEENLQMGIYQDPKRFDERYAIVAE